MNAVEDLAALSDPDLISERARIRAELERLSPGSDDRRTLDILYSVTTQEIDDRARRAWSAA